MPLVLIKMCCLVFFSVERSSVENLNGSKINTPKSKKKAATPKSLQRNKDTEHLVSVDTPKRNQRKSVSGNGASKKTPLIRKVLEKETLAHGNIKTDTGTPLQATDRLPTQTPKSILRPASRLPCSKEKVTDATPVEKIDHDDSVGMIDSAAPCETGMYSD